MLVVPVVPELFVLVVPVVPVVPVAPELLAAGGVVVTGADGLTLLGGQAR